MIKLDNSREYLTLEWLIPEFDPYILNGKSSLFKDNRDYYKHYWWELSDKESRIKAFDKLIEIYRAKI